MKSNILFRYLLSCFIVFCNMNKIHGQQIYTAEDSLQIQKDSILFMQKLAPIYREMHPLSVYYTQQQKKYIAATKNEPNQATLDSMKENLSLIHDSLNTYSNHIKIIALQFIDAHPKSYLSAKYLVSIASLLPLDSLLLHFNILALITKESKYGQELTNIVKARLTVKVGNIAPDFIAEDLNGKKQKLSDYRGKYVLLDFWASWCIPCRKENPNVIKAYQQFKNNNFTVIGISLDRSQDRDKWIEAIKKDGLLGTQLIAPDHAENGTGKLYAITTIPANFLIDPHGKIIAQNLRGSDLHDKLEELFGK